MGSIEENKYVEEEQKPRKWYFHPMIGRVWYSVIYFCATGTTFAAILGCWSPATEKFSLIKTDTSPMISFLANATGFNETQFQHPDLPDSWSWGFSGTCQLYLDPSKDTICYHAFPPLFTIQDLVEKALGSSKESDAAQTLSTWNTALAAKPSDPKYLALTNLSAQRNHSVSRFRGAAVAIFFSLLISFYNCSSSISLFFLKVEENQERKYRHILFGIAIFDFLLYAGAIVCFTFAIAAGPAVLSGESAGSFGQSVGNVGFIVALVALQLRIISIPIVGAIFLCLLGFELVVFAIFLYFSMKILARIAGSDSLRDAL